MKIKICKDCGISNTEVPFKPGRLLCESCYRVRQNSWYKRNSARINEEAKEARAELGKSKWSMAKSIRDHQRTKEWFNHLLEMQDFCCAICLSDVPAGRGGWHVDHCHETGQVRGYLCHYCNLAIGMLRDDPNTMLRAIAYLKNPPGVECDKVKGRGLPETPALKEKDCPRCLKVKPLSDFHESPQGRGQKALWCRDCVKEYRHGHYEKNKEKVLAQNKEWHRENPDKVLAQSRSWAQRNLEKSRAYQKKYRDKKRLEKQLEKLKEAA